MNGVILLRTRRTLRERFTAPAAEIADRLVERGTFDGVTPDAVGLLEEGWEHRLPCGAMAFNAFDPDNELRRTALANAAPVQEWILASRQRESLAPGGFVAQICEAADRGDITHEQAPMLVRSLLRAGVDTTVYGIANTMYALATNPGEWEKLHGEPKLDKFALDEALRWESPVQTSFRTTSRDVEVAGSVIPESSKAQLFLGLANRDPRQWDRGCRSVRHPAVGRRSRRLRHGRPPVRRPAHGAPGVRARASALGHRVPRIELAGPPKPKLNNTLKGWASVPVRVDPA